MARRTSGLTGALAAIALSAERLVVRPRNPTVPIGSIHVFD